MYVFFHKFVKICFTNKQSQIMKNFFALMLVLMLTGVFFTSCGDDDGDDTSAQEAEYTLKYDPNGGSGTIANTIYKVGDKVTLSDGSGFTREGYTFNGWSDTPDGTTLDVNAIANKDATIYAVWKKITEQSTTANVTFDLDGGSWGVAGLASYIAIPVGTDLLAVNDDSPAYAKLIPARDGYTFKGWSNEKGGSVLASLKVEKDVTIYAVWEENKKEETLPAFFPTGKEASNVVAWYAGTIVSEGSVVTDAAFLFNDGSVTVTKNTLADGNNERKVVITLQYWFDGEPDYDNATVNVGPMAGVKMGSAKIDNGVLTVALVPGAEFIKQDNANIPAASDPTAK